MIRGRCSCHGAGRRVWLVSDYDLEEDEEGQVSKVLCRNQTFSLGHYLPIELLISHRIRVNSGEAVPSQGETSNLSNRR